MKLHSFTVGPFQENTYLLIEEDHALLIDPGFAQSSELNAFKQKLSSEQASLEAVVLTHGHVDHLLGLQDVLDLYPVPVYLNGTDRYLWKKFPAQAQAYGFQTEEFDFEPMDLPEQKRWELGPFHFDILYTPGHAPDHVSLYQPDEKMVIAGDALFKESIGRTDLYKGDMNVLKQSIREKLFTLPDETTVYPGHGPSTTIAYEKKNNPFL